MGGDDVISANRGDDHLSSMDGVARNDSVDGNSGRDTCPWTRATRGPTARAECAPRLGIDCVHNGQRKRGYGPNRSHEASSFWAGFAPPWDSSIACDSSDRRSPMITASHRSPFRRR